MLINFDRLDLRNMRYTESFYKNVKEFRLGTIPDTVCLLVLYL